MNRRFWLSRVSCAAVFWARPCGNRPTTEARRAGPELLHPNLGVRTVVDQLITPISIAFLGASDLLVLEKVTGQVKRVTNGAVVATDI